MSEKKLSYNQRQGLSFQSDTPNFLRLLQNQAQSSGRLPRQPSPTDDDEGPDAPEKDDEKPQMVFEKGITTLEVEQFLGEDAKNVNEDTRESSPSEGEEEPIDTTTVKFRKPNAKKKSTVLNSTMKPLDKKRKLVSKPEGSNEPVKKVKNKKLLSFDEDD